MTDFSTAPSKQGTDFELIPDGTLAKAWLVVEPFAAEQGIIVVPRKEGKKNDYLKCKVSIVEGPFERRVIFTNIMRGPDEKGLNMGNAQIRAILEYARNAGPQNPAGYRLDGQPGQEFAPWVTEGIPVAIKIGVEKGSDKPGGGKYADKNTVKLFLSPNPESDGHKDYLRLMKGETGAPAPKAATPAMASKPNWSSQTAAPAAASATPATTAPATQVQPPNGRPAWMDNAR